MARARRNASGTSNETCTCVPIDPAPDHGASWTPHVLCCQGIGVATDTALLHNCNPRSLIEYMVAICWDAVRTCVTGEISVKNYPQLAEVIPPYTDDAPAEELLLSWFNCHLSAASHSRAVNSWTTDLPDCENLAVLLAVIGQHDSPSVWLRAALYETDLHVRTACCQSVPSSPRTFDCLWGQHRSPEHDLYWKPLAISSAWTPVGS